MSNKHNHRLGNQCGERGDGSAEYEHAVSRAVFVRSSLIMFGQMLDSSQLAMAYLLEECRREGYWVHEYSTFTEYVEQEVGIPMRTAQALMRVVRCCNRANVSPERVAQLGWSKLAVVAGHLTAENATELLDEVSNKSHSQLQELMRQRKRKEQTTRKQSSKPKKSAVDVAPIVLSETVQEALRLACLHTHDQSTNTNLEFVAKKFMELCPVPSRVPSGPSLN